MNLSGSVALLLTHLSYNRMPQQDHPSAAHDQLVTDDMAAFCEVALSILKRMVMGTCFLFSFSLHPGGGDAAVMDVYEGRRNEAEMFEVEHMPLYYSCQPGHKCRIRGSCV